MPAHRKVDRKDGKVALGALEDRASTTDQDSGPKLQKRIIRLHDALNHTEELLENFQETNRGMKEEPKQGLEQAWKELKKSIAKARSHFKR